MGGSPSNLTFSGDLTASTSTNFTGPTTPSGTLVKPLKKRDGTDDGGEDDSSDGDDGGDDENQKTETADGPVDWQHGCSPGMKIHVDF